MNKVTIPNAAALAQLLADADVFDVLDVSPVQPVNGRLNEVRFFVDDAEAEYEVIVRKTTRTPAPVGQSFVSEAARRYARVGQPCPCECNSGGFCGGCGHAGCGGRGPGGSTEAIEEALRRAEPAARWLAEHPPGARLPEQLEPGYDTEDAVPSLMAGDLADEVAGGAADAMGLERYDAAHEVQVFSDGTWRYPATANVSITGTWSLDPGDHTLPPLVEIGDEDDG